LSGTVVLVASPDEGTRAQVRLTLGDERFEVIEATDADDAIQVMASTVPALAVLDDQLAGAGALAVARRLRAQPETAQVRTLLLVPRGVATPGDGAEIDATMAVPMTSFALLHRVDELLADTAGD
jgi:DNA-binding response OmpR family regulator